MSMIFIGHNENPFGDNMVVCDCACMCEGAYRKHLINQHFEMWWNGKHIGQRLRRSRTDRIARVCWWKKIRCVCDMYERVFISMVINFFFITYSIKNTLNIRNLCIFVLTWIWECFHFDDVRTHLCVKHFQCFAFLLQENSTKKSKKKQTEIFYNRTCAFVFENIANWSWETCMANRIHHQ